MGELAALLAAALWALASLWYRRLGEGIEPIALNLAKCALACAMIYAALALLGRPLLPRASPEALGWLAFSGVLGLTLGDTVYFMALVRIGARRTLLLWTLAPAVTTLLGVVWLHEPLLARDLGGLALVSLGIGLVVGQRPEGEDALPAGALLTGTLLGVGAAVCQGVGNVVIKRYGVAPEGLQVAAWRLLAGLALLALIVPTRRQLGAVKALAEPSRLRLFLPACFLGTFLGIWLSTEAVLLASSVGVAATLLATSPLWVLAIERLLGRRISLRETAGALLAVSGVGLLMLPAW